MVSLNKILADPFLDALSKHRRKVELGSRSQGGASVLDRNSLIQDLEKARQRNTSRFWLFTAVSILGYSAVLLYVFLHPEGVKPQWLLCGSGAWIGSFGTLLFNINKSWWRTDVMLTVARYASPEELDMMLRNIISAEQKKLPESRK